MLREAKIILPTFCKDQCHASLRQVLISSFGGVTVTEGKGWHTDTQGHAMEHVTIYTVACSAQHVATDTLLREFARQIAKDAGQRSIYLKLPGGHVEFVGPDQNVR